MKNRFSKDKPKIKHFHMRRPVVGTGLLYVLETKGSRDGLRCVIKGRTGISEFSYLSKDYIANRTVAILPSTEEEHAFLDDVAALMQEESDRSIQLSEHCSLPQPL